MTTIRQIVTDAFREANIVGTGETPEADEFDEAVRRLQNLYKSLFGYELGEPLLNIGYGLEGVDTPSYADEYSSEIDSLYIPINVRLVFNIDAAASLKLHPNPRDGARLGIIDNQGNFATNNVTLDGNGRQIELASTVTLNTDSLNREWFYRADLGNWARVTDLDADAESPLPSEFDDFLITLLAFRINPRYAAGTSPEMTEVLKRARSQFRARYRQRMEMESELGLTKLTLNKRYRNIFNNA